MENAMLTTLARKVLTILVCSVLVVPITRADSQAIDTDRPELSLTLQDVIVRVLEKNPLLGINDYESQAAAARIRAARLSSPYEVKVELENIAGSGVYADADQLETTLSLSKIMQPSRTINSRTELALGNSQLVKSKQDSRRLDILARAAGDFIHVAVDQQRLMIANQQLALASKTHNTVSRRVKIGKSHIAEQRRQLIQLARAEIELEHATHELSTSKVKLATQWAATQVDFSRVDTELFNLPAITSFQSLSELLSSNPDLVRYATEERIAQANLELAQSRSRSNITLSGGVRHLKQTDDMALMLSMSIPLGSSSRAQPKIDEMNAELHTQSIRYKQQYLSLYSSLYELYQEILHARTAFQTLTDTIIPQAEKAAKATSQGYLAGRFSLLELNNAQSTLLDARLEKIMTAAKYHQLKIEIERLTGSSLQAGEHHE